MNFSSKFLHRDRRRSNPRCDCARKQYPRLSITNNGDESVTDQRCTSPPSITRMRARTACVNILRNQLRPSAARLTTTFSGRRIFAKFDSCVDRPRDYLIMQSSYCTAARSLQIACRVGCTAAAVFWLFAPPLVVVSVNRDRRGPSKAAGE